MTCTGSPTCNGCKADSAADLIRCALIASMKDERLVRVYGKCDVVEVSELGQVTFSLPAIEISTSLADPRLMAKWVLESLQVAVIGSFERVEDAALVRSL